MEKYREKLKTQNRRTLFFCLLLLSLSALGILAQTGVIPFAPVSGDNHWQSLWRGFLTGSSMGIAGMLFVYWLRSRKALKDEKALRKLYIQETDERAIQIWTAARADAMRYFLLLGLAATIVAGYFSVPVCLTILACVLTNSLLGLGFKVYYSKKF